MEERPANRALFPILGIIMNLCMGNLYAWSVFRIPLQKEMGWSAFDATVPFSVSIGAFAVGMVLAGRWQDKAGPRPVAITGGLLFGAGWALSALMGSTLLGLNIAFGVLGGVGIGFAYVTPIATTVKWWPDKRGLMTGLVVMGFGAGAFIGGIGGPILVANVGALNTLGILGVVFGIIVAGCGTMLRNPPAGYRPAGWTPPAPAPGAKAIKYDYTGGEMVGTASFWMLWIAYLISAGVGLVVISQASPIGQEMAKLTPVVAGGALTLLAVFNGAGRPGFGWISDTIGRKNAWMLVFGFHLISLFLILPNASSFGIYVAGLAFVGFAFGGTLALMPAFTADYFGTKNLGVNYGWLFSAYGVAGVVQPLYAARLRSLVDSWATIFFYLAGACIVGLICAALVRAPAPKEAVAKA
jgi:OFA family oxalate/formate antiporter-like MFS transporter